MIKDVRVSKGRQDLIKGRAQKKSTEAVRNFSRFSTKRGEHNIVKMKQVYFFKHRFWIKKISILLKYNLNNEYK